VATATTTELLAGLELEALVACRLRSLGAEFVWRNESGETNSWPDFYVEGHPLDAKGSDRYEGSMFLGYEAYAWDKRRHFERGGVCYVLNTLVVVGFIEALECAVRCQGGWKIRPEKFMTLEEWVDERRRNEGSDRRRGDLVLEAPGQPPELLATYDAVGMAAG
jgi:hypothetical protein